MQKPLYSYLTSSDLFSGVDGALLQRLEPELEPVRLQGGEVLVRQGEPGDAMYVLVSGEVEVRIANADGSEVVVDTLRAGASVGEMALVTGQRRTATVRARTPAELLRLSRAGFERLADEHLELHEQVVRKMLPRLRRVQLSDVLTAWFGALDAATVHALQDAVDWVHLPAGEALFRQGDASNGMYLLVSGRLQIVQGDAAGGERIFGEVGRGESVGENGVFSDLPRSETVVALRDSHLVVLSRALVETHPQIMVKIARTALQRGQPGLRPKSGDGDSTRSFMVIPAGEGVPVSALAQRLAEVLSRWGPVLRLSSRKVDQAFGREGVGQTRPDEPSDPMLTHWLNEQEAGHRYLVYEADSSLTPWTRRCLRQADKVLVVADATADPRPTALEEEVAHSGNHSPLHLVLVHPDACERPLGTASWLEPRTLHAFHHLRLGVEGDLARLARRLTGRATGLVLSGGGARGYVHIGLIQAIEELGLHVDFVGGTSMGALIGGAYAFAREYEFCYQAAVSFGDRKKLIDRTLPIVALTKSKNVTEVFHRMFGEVRIEDLWIPFFCISANLTHAEPVIHETGPLWRAVRASTAIPGIFTPIVDGGSVLVDGGVMNNFPVDVMRERVDSGVVIGSNAYTRAGRNSAYSFGPSISGWQVLWNRLNPLAKRQRYPSMLGTLMRATSLSSKHLTETMKHLTDLTIQYPNEAFSNMDFDHYEELIELGYQTGGEELARWLEQVQLGRSDQDSSTADEPRIEVGR